MKDGIGNNEILYVDLSDSYVSDSDFEKIKFGALNNYPIFAKCNSNLAYAKLTGYSSSVGGYTFNFKAIDISDNNLILMMILVYQYDKHIQVHTSEFSLTPKI